MGLNNQKVIRFNYTLKLAQGDDEIIFYAARQLNAGAFKLWMYLYKEGMHFGCYDLSRKRVQEEFGIKKTQYNSAIKELIEKGYLVQSLEINSVINLWDFYLMPVIGLT